MSRDNAETVVISLRATLGETREKLRKDMRVEGSENPRGRSVLIPYTLLIAPPTMD